MVNTTFVEVTPTVQTILDAAGVTDESILESSSHLVDAVESLRSTERNLAKTADDVQRVADRVKQRADDGGRLNGSGELQADGPKLDTLVAERQSKIELLTSMVKMAAEK